MSATATFEVLTFAKATSGSEHSSTVYGIVKQSDGYLWVYSEVGVGTTFKTYLPRVDEEARRAPEEDPGGLPRGTETVLLAEDEAALREMLRETLDANGYSVLVAKEGADAPQVAAAHAGPIQLMVTDVIMPGLSGPKLAELAAATRPELKILFVSGYSGESVTRHRLVGPGRAFLSKPFGPDVLLRKDRVGAGRALRGAGGRRGEAAQLQRD